MFNKMEIVLDKEKIESEGYDYDEFVVWLDGLFAEQGLPRDLSVAPSLMYGGGDAGKDWGKIGLMYLTLKKIPEFLSNCRKWLWLTEKYGNIFDENILAKVMGGHGRIGAQGN